MPHTDIVTWTDCSSKQTGNFVSETVNLNLRVIYNKDPLDSEATI